MESKPTEGMSRSMRNSKNASISTDESANENKMAAKKPLTLQDVIDQMQTSMDQLETRIEQKIDDNAEKVSTSLKTSGNKLDIIEKNTTDLSTRVDTLEKEVSAKDKHIEKLSKKIDDLEQEKRNHQVIIEGLPEDKNDNLRRKLDELFAALDLPFDSEWIDLAYRIGTKNDKSTRPRAVKVSFPFLRYRNELFKNTYKLKNTQKFKRVYLVDDYPQDVQENIKELRAVSAFARSKGIDSRVRGTKIIIDGKGYTHKEMSNLPHNL